MLIEEIVQHFKWLSSSVWAKTSESTGSSKTHQNPVWFRWVVYWIKRKGFLMPVAHRRQSHTARINLWQLRIPKNPKTQSHLPV